MGADAIAMLKLTLIKVCHSPETNVRMRTHIDPAIGDKFRRTHLIEKDERPNHLALGRWQRAAHIKPADIPRTGNDQCFQRTGGAWAFGTLGRVPTHLGHLSNCGSVGNLLTI